MLDYMRDGDFSKGITEGFNAIVSQIAEEYQVELTGDYDEYANRLREDKDDEIDLRTLIIIFIIFMIFSRFSQGEEALETEDMEASADSGALEEDLLEDFPEALVDFLEEVSPVEEAHLEAAELAEEYKISKQIENYLLIFLQFFKIFKFKISNYFIY